MKDRISIFLYSMFGLTLMIILFELGSVSFYHRQLSRGFLGLPSNSASAELASDVAVDFLASQIAASHTRYRTVAADLLKHCLYISAACCFLAPKLRRKILRLCDNRITILRSDFRGLKRVEVNFLSLAVAWYFFVVLVVSFVKSFSIDFLKLFEFGILFCFLCYCIVPFVILLLYVLIVRFGRRFLIACYVAYALKTLPELLVQDVADEKRMTLMDIRVFPTDVQEVLIQYGLEKSVYKELIPGKDINAALIGYGSGKRMEVYGPINDFSKAQMSAIVLHEVGHVAEHSLVRKSIFYFGLLGIEAFLLVTVLSRMAPKYACSTFTAFGCLFLIYRLLLRQYVFAAHRLVSQHSENNSDAFARLHGYSSPLATALFDIGVESRDYLRPSYIYNGLRSTHPSIYSRVENLKK